MRRAITVTVRVVALGMAISASSVAGAPTPKIKAGTPYATAREMLKAAGWQPHHQLKRTGCSSEFCSPYPEVLDCYGVGRAPCLYTWRRGAHVMLVWGQGEGDQEYDQALVCRSLRLKKDRYGSWVCA